MSTDRPDDKRPADEGAGETLQPGKRKDMGPPDPAASFSREAVPSVNVVKPSPSLKKKLNDLPNAADDPKRSDIPPELKI
jgi:hypothetical protein